MVEPWQDRGAERAMFHSDLLDMDMQERLPWPAAVLTIGLLSLTAWGVLGGIATLLFR